MSRGRQKKGPFSEQKAHSADEPPAWMAPDAGSGSENIHFEDCVFSDAPVEELQPPLNYVLLAIIQAHSASDGRSEEARLADARRALLGTPKKQGAPEANDDDILICVARADLRQQLFPDDNDRSLKRLIEDALWDMCRTECKKRSQAWMEARVKRLRRKYEANLRQFQSRVNTEDLAERQRPWGRVLSAIQAIEKLAVPICKPDLPGLGKHLSRGK